MNKLTKGQKVFVVSVNRGITTTTIATVTKVGTKYFEINNESGWIFKGIKFYKSTMKEKTEYSSKFTVYLSKEAYEEALEKSKIWNRLHSVFNRYNVPENIPVAKLLDIENIINTYV